MSYDISANMGRGETFTYSPFRLGFPWYWGFRSHTGFLIRIIQKRCVRPLECTLRWRFINFRYVLSHTQSLVEETRASASPERGHVQSHTHSRRSPVYSLALMVVDWRKQCHAFVTLAIKLTREITCDNLTYQLHPKFWDPWVVPWNSAVRSTEVSSVRRKHIGLDMES